MTEQEININNPLNDLDDETFDYQDDTQVQENLETDKYTKIDCLDEDPEINKQNFVLLSFVSPEGIMNCKIRGVKVRGVYSTEAEARAACDKLKQIDKYFDIFVGEMGKWLPWDPTPEQVKEVKYRHKKLDKIMSKVHDTEMNTLNEVVGRRKEMIDKAKITHNKRIKKSIKESVDTYTDSTTTSAPTAEINPKKQQNQKHSDDVRKRLRTILDEREKAKNAPPKIVSGKVDVTNEPPKKIRIQHKKDEGDEVKKTSAEIDDKLKKMKDYLNQKKAE
jgi:hypothetical protein